MSELQKHYWQGIEELKNDPAFVQNVPNEFPEGITEEREGASRRDFLKKMGFSLAAASLAACEAPVKKAIPYLNKPVDIDPGIANYYASTYVNGGDYCSVVVKTREGRPIKIEGNSLCKVSQGGTSAQVEASILSLYDKQRFNGPRIEGAAAKWDDLDAQVIAELNRINQAGGQIRLVSNTILSPSTKKAVQDFITAFPTAKHITYDPISSYAIVKSHEETHGNGVLPTYDFGKAKATVSFGADFLGTWINPILFSRQYAHNRKLGKGKKEMSRHFQFETNLTTTGANADYRSAIKPSQEGIAVAHLYNYIARKTGNTTLNVPQVEIPHLEQAAEELWQHQGASLVVSSSNDVAVQSIINAINYFLGNYGHAIDLSKPSHLRQGNDEEMNTLVQDLTAGRVDGVIFLGCNPVYDHVKGASIKDALANVSLTVSTSDRKDETTEANKIIAPSHHFLESWDDAEPVQGHFSLIQPTISPLFKTRQAAESLLKWSGSSETYYEYLQKNWRENQFTTQTEYTDFQQFWDKALHDGVFEGHTPVETEGDDVSSEANFIYNVASAQNAISQYKADNTGIELALYQKVGIGNGSLANNPWLQEMPDPITKATWDNYLTISQSMASKLGVKMVESATLLLNLTVGDQTMKVPALVQPGQALGTVGLALGYGRTAAGRVADGVGIDAYPLVQVFNGTQSLSITEGVSVSRSGEKYDIAQTQTHHTYMGRENVIQESTLVEYVKNPRAGRHSPKIATHQGPKSPESISLWKGHKYNGHHWGMMVDLNSCTGCSACTVACQAENNIPVVGKQEVINRREMAWIRIDRYYSSDAPVTDREGLEKASENPEVTFQPMMCQHCNNAPCETVCPVAATTHSTEGLNQMTYNRCIGTRYCANNCPYKVRRFNWFKYHDNTRFPVNTTMNNDLGKMVLNPDVTVRARGVMEKCSFCVQRIQAGKLEAKREGRKVKDGEITTACAVACPTEAIVFGDMNDEKSKISKALKLKDEDNLKTAQEDRAYHVLEEIGVRPNVWYLTKIRNKDSVSHEA